MQSSAISTMCPYSEHGAVMFAQVGISLGSRLDSASLAYGAALLAEAGGAMQGQ